MFCTSAVFNYPTLISIMRIPILALGISLALVSCSKSDVQPIAGLGTGTGDSTDTLTSALAATSFMDVSYGDSREQRMDVHLPENRSKANTRTIVIVHGGGWTAGDKSDFNGYITELQKRLPGYAFANVNYRLAKLTGDYFPTQENDMISAMQFLKSKTAEYNISNNFIYIGISAGAHLVLLQGYKHSDVVAPVGIVSFFGPTDLEQLYINSDSTIPGVLRSITHSSLEANPTILHESSPINYVSETSAPTLMLHGTADRLVPVEQAEMLHKKLDEFHVKNRLVVYPGLGHDGWVGQDLENAFQEVQDFIQRLPT